MAFPVLHLDRDRNLDGFPVNRDFFAELIVQVDSLSEATIIDMVALIIFRLSRAQGCRLIE